MRTSSSGIASLILTLFVLVIILVVGLSVGFDVVLEQREGTNRIASLKSYYIAETAIEDYLLRYNRGEIPPPANTYSSTLFNGSGSGAISVANDPQNQNILLLTARAESAKRAREFEVRILKTAQTVNFNYGLQIGYLGLTMRNSSKVVGSVYSNGNIDVRNTGHITGDAWVAAGTAATPDQKQETQTDTLNLHDVQARLDGAQSFTPSITAEVRKIGVYIKKVGNPAAVIDIKILADNNGVPKSSNALATGRIYAQDVTSSFAWVEVALNSISPVIQNQPHWLLFDTDNDNISKYYVIGAAADTSYPSGTFLYSPRWDAVSPVWTTTGKDSMFRVYLGTVTTSIEGATVGQAGVGDVRANTIKDSTIARNAYYQTITNSTVGGTSYPGSPDPPPLTMPLSSGQIAQFKADGDAGGTCGQPPCDAQGNLDLLSLQQLTIGPIRIPGRLKLDNQAQITMNGTIHVVGDLMLNNKCVVKLAPGYGTAGGIIVVDGKVDVDNECTFEGSGNPASYIMIITTSSQMANPYALRVSNKATGVIFYAAEGAMKAENNAALKEAVAQKMVLENSAQVTYESGLAHALFTAGPGGGYKVVSWKEK